WVGNPRIPQGKEVGHPRLITHQGVESSWKACRRLSFLLETEFRDRFLKVAFAQPLQSGDLCRSSGHVCNGLGQGFQNNDLFRINSGDSRLEILERLGDLGKPCFETRALLCGRRSSIRLAPTRQRLLNGNRWAWE